MKTILDELLSFFSTQRHFHCKRSEIVAYQRQRLRRLIHHAYHHVRYYRRLLDRHGLKPEVIREVEDLALIPVTTKRDLQSLSAEDILYRGVNPSKLMIFHTSGSSGEPFRIRRTTFEHLILRALYLRSMRDMGLRTFDAIALITNSHTTNFRQQPLMWRMLQTLDPRRRTQIVVLEPLARIRQRLRRFQPDVIIGYASQLARLAETLSSEDRKRIRPRFLKADSEVLTPQMRETIVRGFGAPVFEMFDSHEFFMLAWECNVTGELHVCDDGIILEVLKNGRPCAEGERGEVVVTSLHSYAMPFIRYRLGDIVTKGRESCGCGLPFSTIRSVQGRMIDLFPLPDGRHLHPYDIVSLLKRMAGWLGQYQLMQERRDRIVLRIVPVSPPSSEDLARLEAAIKSVVGSGVELQICVVPKIDVEASGKFRVARSFVNSLYDDMRWDLE